MMRFDGLEVEECVTPIVEPETVYVWRAARKAGYVVTSARRLTETELLDALNAYEGRVQSIASRVVPGEKTPTDTTET